MPVARGVSNGVGVCRIIIWGLSHGELTVTVHVAGHCAPGRFGREWRGSSCLIVLRARLRTPVANPLLPLPPQSTAIDSDPGNNEALGKVIKEVSALMDLGQHPNIIRLVGVCADPPRIITEYYRWGQAVGALSYLEWSPDSMSARHGGAAGMLQGALHGHSTSTCPCRTALYLRLLL